MTPCEPVISVICEQFAADRAVEIVSSLAGGVASRIERKVLYPYFHFAAQCRVPTLAGRRAMAVDCLVDGVNGNGATADPFDRSSVARPGAGVLSATIESATAGRIAARTVTHRLGRKFRLIAPFEVDIAPQGIVYRGFWIACVGDGKVMVDSVTGAVQSLRARAA